MIIGADRKYQVKVCVCRAFGEVANRILHAGAQRRTGKRAKTRTTTKSKPKKAIKQIRQAKKLEIAAVF